MDTDTPIIGSITFSHPAPMAEAHMLDELHRLRQGNARLLRQLAFMRKWYDEENPPEDGHDQVYPWDPIA